MNVVQYITTSNNNLLYAVLLVVSERLLMFKKGKDKSKSEKKESYWKRRVVMTDACLPQMWKLLTSIFSEAMYEHFTCQELLLNEQKGCRKNSRGTKDQLLIDKAILNNCRRRLTNLSMAWIDYRKSYDMHFGRMVGVVGVAQNMITLIENSMVNWKTVLTSNQEVLRIEDIKRGIFQGDSLSPLLFCYLHTTVTDSKRH